MSLPDHTDVYIDGIRFALPGYGRYAGDPSKGVPHLLHLTFQTTIGPRKVLGVKVPILGLAEPMLCRTTQWQEPSSQLFLAASVALTYFLKS